VATGATSTTGGTNASQIGLGTKVSSISTNITENGAAQSTNNTYDLMLNGESFFVVGRGDTNYFTKVGAFEIDGSGCLVTSNGYQVKGWQVDPSNPNDVKRDVVSALYPEAASTKVSSPEQTSQAYFDGNIDFTDSDLTSVDGSVLSLPIYDAAGYSYTCKFKLTKDTSVEDNSLYNLEITSIKDSKNVEILGDDDPATDDIVEGGYTAAIGGGSSIQIKMDPSNGSFVCVGGVDDQSTALLTITPNSGDYADSFQSYINGEQVDGITLDFSNLTMYQSGGESTATIVRGSTASEGGGRAMGIRNDISIDTSGKIYGVYSNGETKLLGQIAVATFTNPMALESIGNSMYTTTQNSGEFDGVGSAVDDDGGSMAQGVLEMSNVDLSTEFTEMITTQRGFQANSRIITTSDSMLEELVNLKR
jgi:flagellar hook protein FlgE